MTKPDIRGLFKESIFFTHLQMFFVSCFFVLTSGIFLNDYFNKLGFTEYHFGFYNALLSIAIIVSLPISIIANRTPHKRRFFVSYGLVSVLMIPLFAIIPYIGGGNEQFVIWASLLTMAASATIIAVGYMVLIPWLHSIMPDEKWARFFSFRQILGFLPGIILTPLLGMLLWKQGIAHLTWIFIGATVLGILGITFMCFVPEYKYNDETAAPAEQKTSLILREALHNKPFMRVVFYTVLMALGLGFYGPVVFKYLTDRISMNSTSLSIFQSIMSLASIVAFFMTGRICEAKGNYFLMKMTAGLAGVVPVLLLMTPLSPVIFTLLIYLIGIAEGSGFIMSSIMIAYVGLLLRHTPHENKILYMQVNTFFKLTAVSVSSYISGVITKNVGTFHVAGIPIDGYTIAFVLAALSLGASFVLVLASGKLLNDKPQDDQQCDCLEHDGD